MNIRSISNNKLAFNGTYTVYLGEFKRPDGRHGLLDGRNMQKEIEDLPINWQKN